MVRILYENTDAPDSVSVIIVPFSVSHRLFLLLFSLSLALSVCLSFSYSVSLECLCVLSAFEMNKNILLIFTLTQQMCVNRVQASGVENAFFSFGFSSFVGTWTVLFFNFSFTHTRTYAHKHRNTPQQKDNRITQSSTLKILHSRKITISRPSSQEQATKLGRGEKKSLTIVRRRELDAPVPICYSSPSGPAWKHSMQKQLWLEYERAQRRPNESLEIVYRKRK